MRHLCTQWRDLCETNWHRYSSCDWTLEMVWNEFQNPTPSRSLAIHSQAFLFPFPILWFIPIPYHSHDSIPIPSHSHSQFVIRGKIDAKYNKIKIHTHTYSWNASSNVEDLLSKKAGQCNSSVKHCSVVKPAHLYTSRKWCRYGAIMQPVASARRRTPSTQIVYKFLSILLCHPLFLVIGNYQFFPIFHYITLYNSSILVISNQLQWASPNLQLAILL